ncbi:hypothetical protein [Phyllobacterium sp. K27]
MKESDIHKAVIDHWRAVGLPGTLVATLPNMGAMGQHGLTKGLPDLMVIAPGLPIGFIELKADRGNVTGAQRDFQLLCLQRGIPIAITFGRDQPIHVLEHWNVVRRAAS